MKNKSFLILSLIGIFLSSLIFMHCQKEEKVISEVNTPSYLALEIEANNFVQFFDPMEEEYTGLFVKVVEGNIVFEKVKKVENEFFPIPLEEQPELKQVLVNGNGEISNINPDAITEKVLLTLDDNFDFAYFNWKNMELIAANSENLYFSTTKINYGPSIHSLNAESIDRLYSSIKVEGDFKKFISLRDGSSTPTYLLGVPCPPDWRTGG